MSVSFRSPKEPSADLTSFFKVMIGDEFSEVMVLPPRLARTISNLTNQKFELEDANGLSWTVTLSKYKGYLAFQKGWKDFSVQHGLKIGDFLVFKILKHAHFLVTIYGRSGCEKLSLPECKGNERKRKRTNERSDERNKYVPLTDSDDANVQSVPNIDAKHSTPMVKDYTSNTGDDNNLKVLSNMNYTEEPFYMINRDIEVGQGELRDSLYDLESFEMRPCGKPVLEKETSQGQNDTIPNFDGEVSPVGDIPVAKEVQNCLTISGVGKGEIKRNSTDVGQIDNRTPIAKNNSESEIATGTGQCSNEISGKEQFLVSWNQKPENKSTGSFDFSDLAIAVKPGAYSSGTGKSLKEVKREQVEMKEETRARWGRAGKSSKVVKSEQVERIDEDSIFGGTPGHQFTMKLDQSSYPSIEVNNHVPNVVKAEPVDTIDLDCSVVAKIPSSFKGPEKQPYLELPDRLVPAPQRANHRLERQMVVYLCGPVTSAWKWPVLYHERRRFKVLTSGWDAFRKANGISAGDECVFSCEDRYGLIFRVAVLPK